MAELYPGAHRLVTIDPGLGGTGWALWTSRAMPDAVGVVRDVTKDESLANRCAELSGKLLVALEHENRLVHRPDTYVFLEMPQHMANVKGIAAQAGSVYKLTFLVGYLAARFCKCQVVVVTPGEWKGQLPKDVVQRRVTRILGWDTVEDLNIQSHAWDAVGLGLWAMGRL